MKTKMVDIRITSPYFMLELVPGNEREIKNLKKLKKCIQLGSTKVSVGFTATKNNCVLLFVGDKRRNDLINLG